MSGLQLAATTSLERGLGAGRIGRSVRLAPYTTFKIGGAARYFVAVRTLRDLEEALAFRRAEGLKIFVLGGGSNILVSDSGFDGLVVHPVQDGIAVVSDGAAGCKSHQPRAAPGAHSMVDRIMMDQGGSSSTLRAESFGQHSYDLVEFLTRE